MGRVSGQDCDGRLEARICHARRLGTEWQLGGLSLRATSHSGRTCRSQGHAGLGEEAVEEDTWHAHTYGGWIMVVVAATGRTATRRFLRSCAHLTREQPATQATAAGSHEACVPAVYNGCLREISVRPCRWASCSTCASGRAFARIYEAKTDPLDAQVLSRYGVFSESDTAQPEVDPDREELRHAEQASSACGAAGAGAQPTGQGRKCERREVDQAARPLA